MNELSTAVFAGRRTDVIRIVGGGFDVNSIDPDTHRTALQTAVNLQEGDEQMVQLLLSLGAKINITTPEAAATPDISALNSAVILEKAYLVKLFLDQGAVDVNTYRDSHFKRTSLHIAAFNGDMDTAKLLVEHGANLKAVDSEDLTPAAFARREGQTELAEYLEAQAKERVSGDSIQSRIAALMEQQSRG